MFLEKFIKIVIGDYMLLKDDERIDDLEFNNLKIIQNKNGFCFGIDSILISDYAKKDIKGNAVGIDLGTGTGIISILLSAKTSLSKIIGIEVQKEVADMARRSIELNGLQDKIEIRNMNIKNIIQNSDNSKLEKEQAKLGKTQTKSNKEKANIWLEKFDFVVTNPPYKEFETGKVNENEHKYISRHEVTANLEDFMKVSKYVLKDKGYFFMVHRPNRLVDVIELMRKYKIEPKSIRFVHSSIDKEPNLVLIKGRKNANPFLKIDKPLIVYDSNGKYTNEIYKIYGKQDKIKI